MVHCCGPSIRCFPEFSKLMHLQVGNSEAFRTEVDRLERQRRGGQIWGKIDALPDLVMDATACFIVRNTLRSTLTKSKSFCIIVDGGRSGEGGVLSLTIHQVYKWRGKGPCSGIFISVPNLFSSAHGSCMVLTKKLPETQSTHTHTRTYLLYSTHVLSHSYLGGWLEQSLCLGAVHDTTQSLADCRNGFHLILIWCIYEPNSPPPFSHATL